MCWCIVKHSRCPQFNTTDRGKNPHNNRQSSWRPTLAIALPLDLSTLAYALRHKALVPEKPPRPPFCDAPQESIGIHTARQWRRLR